MTRMQMLFTGVFGTLALASVIGGSLKFAVARGQAHGVIDNLNARIRAWWWMVALIGIALCSTRAECWCCSGWRRSWRCANSSR